MYIWPLAAIFQIRLLELKHVRLARFYRTVSYTPNITVNLSLKMCAELPKLKSSHILLLKHLKGLLI